MGNRWGNSERLYFGGSQITADGDCSHEIKRHLLLGRKVMTNLDSILESRDITLSSKGPSSQGYCFSSGHVRMWELDYKESWARKNWCFWTVVLEKTLESPLDCKESQTVHPKGNRSWIFIERTNVEAETPILWPPDVKSWLIWKDPDAGKDWRREEKGTTEDEMVGWYHWHDGHEFEQALEGGDGQGSLVCCSPWGCKDSDTTERLTWTSWLNTNFSYHISSKLCGFQRFWNLVQPFVSTTFPVVLLCVIALDLAPYIHWFTITYY